MTEHSPKRFSRRTLGKAALWTSVAVGIPAAIDQGPRVVEYLPPTHSEIVFQSQQERRLAEANSACLIFGGATIRSPEGLMHALTPALEPLGPVGGILYAKDDLDTKSIAANIRRLKHNYGIADYSLYLHSLGAQVAGEVLELVGEEITINHIFLDCVPPSFAYLDHSTSARLIGDVPYDGGALVTGFANFSTYGTPFQEGSAYSGLLWDEFEALRAGERYIGDVAVVAKRDNSTVSYLTPKDPTADTIVNSPAAEERLRELFPGLRAYRLGGNQVHGNSPHNTKEYQRAIREALSATA